MFHQHAALQPFPGHQRGWPTRIYGALLPAGHWQRTHNVQPWGYVLLAAHLKRQFRCLSQCWTDVLVGGRSNERSNHGSVAVQQPWSCATLELKLWFRRRLSVAGHMCHGSGSVGLDIAIRRKSGVRDFWRNDCHSRAFLISLGHSRGAVGCASKIDFGEIYQARVSSRVRPVLLRRSDRRRNRRVFLVDCPQDRPLAQPIRLHPLRDLSHMLAHTAWHLAFLARRVSEVDSCLAAE